MAALFGLLIAVSEYRRRNRNNVNFLQGATVSSYRDVQLELHYKSTAILGRLPDYIKIESNDGAGNFLRECTALRLRLINPNEQRMERVCLKWDNPALYDIFSLTKSTKSSLDKDVVKVRRAGTALMIEIDELPAKEEVTIDMLIHGTAFALAFLTTLNARVLLKAV